MTINGVQYEMGTDIIDEIKEITDSQWVADQPTLNNVLFEASISPIVYEDFIVTDYIHDDYFRINSRREKICRKLKNMKKNGQKCCRKIRGA